MGGVDLADQAMCYYSVGRKTMKWWRRVFWRVHDMAITNAVVLHKENSIRTNTNALSQKLFRMKLAYSFTAPALQLRRSLGRPHATALDRLKGKHFIYRSSVRRRCAVCANKKTSSRGKKRRDKKIMTWCPKCEAHLCESVSKSIIPE